MGKTTTAINLGAALAEAGHRVGLIDLDPQGHLTEGLGVKAQDDPAKNMAVALLGRNRGLELAQLRVARGSNLWVIPSSVDLFMAEPQLAGAIAREHRLEQLLPPLAGDTDYLVIDCPPTLGALTDNALVAAKTALVTVQARGASLRALEILFDQIDSLKLAKVQVRVLGLVANEVKSTSVARRTLDGFRAAELPVLAEIRERVELQEAWDAGKSVLEWRPRSDVAQWFRDLAGTVEHVWPAGELMEASR